MQFKLSLALAATALTASVAATSSGCSTSFDGEFQITVVKPTSKRNLMTRDSTCGKDGYLTLKLHEGNLIDSKGRIGYIASNYQFQFDGPPQENAASVGGYSACQNGSLALAGSSIFYQCLSGDFYNLYDRYWAAQCQPIHIDILPCKNEHSSGNPVSQIGDGQPQAPSATPRIPISQIPDGQPQAPTATPRAPTPQKPKEKPEAPIAAPAPSAPPAPPVIQISDGQPQVPTTVTIPSVHNTTTVPTKSLPTTTSPVETTTKATPEKPTTTPVEGAGSKLIKVSSIGALIMAAAVSTLFL
ncbi:putative covalently-linked cell wall protein [Erysiphe neolycopersici]|uniref:Putative covalently-linked cell wall protein n=1 Tax=Erysiphe neolycopersici TaxID=212602 RepID=A0A420I4M5_9PEZI|nr:putative covalently-linked cell wall protein [Erysiphe neolycopersici]